MDEIKTIILVDDHRLILEGLEKMLSGLEQNVQLYTATSAKEVLDHPKLIDADLVISDIEMDGMNGIELLKELKENYPQKKVLMLSMHNNSGLVKEIINLLADGYLLKSADEKEIRFAVEQILNGKKFFSHDLTLGLADNEIVPEVSLKPLDDLTPREIEILKLIASGLTNKEIAEKLFIAIKTVDTHRTNLMQKLDLHNAAGLTRFAIRNQLI